MARVSQLLSKDLVSMAELELKNLGKYGQIAHRLQIIIAAAKHGITKVCEVHDISRTTLTYWIKRLEGEGMNGLINKSKAPRRRLLQHQEKIREWVEKDPNITVRELIIKAESRFGISVGQTSMRNLLKNLICRILHPAFSITNRTKSPMRNLKKSRECDTKKS